MLVSPFVDAFHPGQRRRGPHLAPKGGRGGARGSVADASVADVGQPDARVGQPDARVPSLESQIPRKQRASSGLQFALGY